MYSVIRSRQAARLQLRTLEIPAAAGSFAHPRRPTTMKTPSAPPARKDSTSTATRDRDSPAAMAQLQIPARAAPLPLSAPPPQSLALQAPKRHARNTPRAAFEFPRRSSAAAALAPNTDRPDRARPSLQIAAPHPAPFSPSAPPLPRYENGPADPGKCPVEGIRPGVGFRPQIPVKCAGTELTRRHRFPPLPPSIPQQSLPILLRSTRPAFESGPKDYSRARKLNYPSRTPSAIRARWCSPE